MLAFLMISLVGACADMRINERPFLGRWKFLKDDQGVKHGCLSPRDTAEAIRVLRLHNLGEL